MITLLKKIYEKITREDGASAVMAAAAFLAVIMLSGVVIDLGRMNSETSRLQAIADASVYACASLLPIDTSDNEKLIELENMAAEYVIKNGGTSDLLEAVIPSGEVAGKFTKVQVVLTERVDYLFGRILALDGKTVTKTATAAVESVTSSTNMVPLGVSIDTLLNAIALGDLNDIILHCAPGDADQGSYGALNLSGTHGGGANSYSQWLLYGYEGIIYAGDLLYEEQGYMDDPMVSSFTERFDSCTHFPGDGGCTPEHFDADCRRVISVIVYEQISDNQIEVLGFRPFILTGISPDGEMLASGIDIKSNTGDSEPVNETNINYGLFRIKLVD